MLCLRIVRGQFADWKRAFAIEEQSSLSGHLNAGVQTQARKNMDAAALDDIYPS
jgi:hypothetical protein